jgi:hypothetical protein
MKLKIDCSGKLVRGLEYAAKACGVSRTHFTRSVLGSAVASVIEREAQYRAFDEYLRHGRTRTGAMMSPDRYAWRGRGRARV